MEIIPRCSVRSRRSPIYHQIVPSFRSEAQDSLCPPILKNREGGENVIEFKAVSKVYPNSDAPAVKELSFEVPDGEICVLVGPSGCGKTTSMRMVNRLIEPSSGEILIDGQPNTAMSGTE